ncbi:MAG: glycine/sarcosine/betaine reductase complex component C subunit beta [Enterobacteriaceae bacterium]
MGNAVIRHAGFILAHVPDMLVWYGSTAQQLRMQQPDAPYLAEMKESLRSFEQAVNYPPNQCYIGNITPEQLAELSRPWSEHKQPMSPMAPHGAIFSQEQFYALLCYVDAFELTAWLPEFIALAQKQAEQHPKMAALPLFDKAVQASEQELRAAVEQQHAAGLYLQDRLVGCVKAAHDLDINLNAHVMLENLATKASAVMAGWQIPEAMLQQVEYVIECSEEAVGDVNQRGGGNLAKAVAESLGCQRATGIDMRGFCAAPVHGLLNAAALVKSGVYRHVLVLAGGSVAKLGMNGRDHVKHNLPLLEDMIGGFAVLVSEDDGVSPVINTAVSGRHSVGTGSSPQAVMASLISHPLKAASMTSLQVDKYSVEMQNPEITQPAGAGNVPEANYKMIAALSVMEGWLERGQIADFVSRHGMPGFAPTQGHIPSGIPYIGHGVQAILNQSIDNFMVVGKGSLFLGRMTNQFDGVSVLIERNKGKGGAPRAETDSTAMATLLAEAMRKVADSLEKP